MKKITLILTIMLAFLTVSCGTGNNPAIQASGQIEATEITIAPEISGQVIEVIVNEGDSVKKGDLLLRLDDDLLKQQQKAANANLEFSKSASLSSQNALDIAKAQYQVTLQEALAQDKTTRLGDWYSKDQKQFDQPNWYFTRTEQTQAVQLQVDEASKALEDAKSKLTDVTKELDKADFLAAEQRLLNARVVYQINKVVNTHAENSNSAYVPVTQYNLRNCAKDQGYRFANPEIMNQVVGCNADANLTKVSQILYDSAKKELSQAQESYNNLLATQAAREILQARAEVSVAQEKYYVALDQLRTLQTGDQSPMVTAALGNVNQAQTNYDQSLDAIKQAQANLDIINAQIDKLSLHAPTDGTILTRSAEVGEVIQAGMPTMTIGKLDTLRVTVYIPEDKYGIISLGQQAALNVDSFPNESFHAMVTRIANQAEFTPQNVQTKEGRQTTVYAIELTINNADGKLKPGMPVDVTFNNLVAGK